MEQVGGDGMVIGGERYVTLAEATVRLRMAHSSLLNWVTMGRVRGTRHDGRWYVLTAEVERLERTPQRPLSRAESLARATEASRQHQRTPEGLEQLRQAREKLAAKRSAKASEAE